MFVLGAMGVYAGDAEEVLSEERPLGGSIGDICGGGALITFLERKPWLT